MIKFKFTAIFIVSIAAFTIQADAQDLRYPAETFTVSQNVAISAIKPINPPGTFSSFKILPSLSPRLSFDTISGLITGIPDEIGIKSYTVIAKKGTDSSKYVLAINVIPAESNRTTTKEKLTYQPSVYEFTSDSQIQSIKPGKDSPQDVVYEVSPALPLGLRINSATGEISGTPVSACKSTTFTITAKKPDNTLSGEFSLNIAVAPKPDFVTLPSTIKFVGEGSIQQAISNGSKLPANTGIGVVYREYSSTYFKWLHGIEAELSINIASTVDTIKSINNSVTNEVINKGDFGTSVLLPINSGQAFAFRLTGFFTERGGKAGNYRRNLPPEPLLGFISGAKIAVVSSNRNWEFIDTSKTSTLVKASLLNTYVGIFYEFITPSEKNNYGQNASMTFGLGYSGRWILGDAQQDPQGNLRKRLLGSERKSFSGLELNFGLRFYNIKAEARLPFLRRKDNIPGLSGAQPNYFIGFSGGFPIDLTKRAD